MSFQLLKVETQSVQACSIFTTFRYNQTQYRRVEVASLGYHMVIHAYLIQHMKHWIEEKILKKFTNEYF